MLHFDLCTRYIVLESGETHSFVVETSKIFSSGLPSSNI